MKEKLVLSLHKETKAYIDYMIKSAELKERDDKFYLVIRDGNNDISEIDAYISEGAPVVGEYHISHLKVLDLLYDNLLEHLKVKFPDAEDEIDEDPEDIRMDEYDAITDLWIEFNENLEKRLSLLSGYEIILPRC